MTFRVGKTDAKFYEGIYYDPDIKEGFKANDLSNLGLGEVVMRVITKSGIQSDPFSAKTFPPCETSSEANPELIIRRSRRSICKPREQIRKSIEDRMRMDEMVE